MDDRRDLGARIAQALLRHPAVEDVRLTGSRARGEAGPLSDWDFHVLTSETAAVAAALPALVAELRPVAEQWDPLSPHWVYTLLLRGPTKVDLMIGDEPHEPAQPWRPAVETLPVIDAHFWDWTFWLASKRARGLDDLVAAELAKMHWFLLAPLGVADVPSSIDDAVVAYRAARARAEARFGLVVDRRLEDAVREVTG